MTLSPEEIEHTPCESVLEMELHDTPSLLTREEKKEVRIQTHWGHRQDMDVKGWRNVAGK